LRKSAQACRVGQVSSPKKEVFGTRKGGREDTVGAFPTTGQSMGFGMDIESFVEQGGFGQKHI